LNRGASVRTLATCSAPAATNWLRQVAAPYLQHCKEPGPIAAEEFGPKTIPRWLEPEDGMRLALAFSAARWLAGAAQRRMFRDALAALPSEVLLYWFTLCFYGYRQAAGRAALRVLLTHPERNEDGEVPSVPAQEEAVPPAGVVCEEAPQLAQRSFGEELASYLIGEPAQPGEPSPRAEHGRGSRARKTAARGRPS
jgi:hypothetical protein